MMMDLIKKLEDWTDTYQKYILEKLKTIDYEPNGISYEIDYEYNEFIIIIYDYYDIDTETRKSLENLFNAESMYENNGDYYFKIEY